MQNSVLRGISELSGGESGGRQGVRAGKKKSERAVRNNLCVRRMEMST